MLLPFNESKKYECQGIGHGATCGKEATVPVRSYKWNVEKERVEKVEVWICSDHFTELKKFK